MDSRSVVQDVLAEYSPLIRASVTRYLPAREPSHYLYDVMADYPRRGGRGMRPTLCLVVARAFGAPIEKALGVATAIELLHNAMLIHDDIEDESTHRRGVPTLHELHGVPIAINAGDALSVRAFEPVLDAEPTLGPALTLQLMRELRTMAEESAEGQAWDIGWRRDNTVDLSEADYLRMVLKKTCWLATIYPCRAGYLIGTGLQSSAAILEHLTRYAFLVGAAFQIQDDVLNLIGDGASYGKELAGDIYEGKRTLMLIHLLQNADKRTKNRVIETLALPRAQRSPAEVTFIHEQMITLGCVRYAQQFANALSGAALYELGQIIPAESKSKELGFLRDLPRWVIERS